MLLVPIQLDLVVDVADLAVDAHAHETSLADVVENLVVLALATSHQRRQVIDLPAAGMSRTASTICSAVPLRIGRPHFGQCGWPMRANRSRR